MITLKLLKSKAFKANSEDHTHYTAAYKGRVFGISTLRFDAGNIKVDEKTKTVTLSDDVEVLKNVSVDPLTGESRTFLDLVPKSGLIIAEF